MARLNIDVEDMTRLIDTRVEARETDGRKIVAFTTNEGEFEASKVDGIAVAELGFEPIDPEEAVRIVAEVADDIGTEAVQLACEVIAEIDEAEMEEVYEVPETDQTIVATKDGIEVIDE